MLVKLDLIALTADLNRTRGHVDPSRLSGFGNHCACAYKCLSSQANIVADGRVTTDETMLLDNDLATNRRAGRNKTVVTNC